SQQENNAEMKRVPLLFDLSELFTIMSIMYGCLRAVRRCVTAPGRVCWGVDSRHPARFTQPLRHPAAVGRDRGGAVASCPASSMRQRVLLCLERCDTGRALPLVVGRDTSRAR